MRQNVGSCQTLRHARVPLAGEACPRAQASPAKGTGGSGDKNDTEMNSTSYVSSTVVPKAQWEEQNKREARELKKGKEQETGMMGKSTERERGFLSPQLSLIIY